MTPQQYQAIRRLLGSQKSVARSLGIGSRTLQRREAGDVSLLPENILALNGLAVTQVRRPNKKPGRKKKLNVT